MSAEERTAEIQHQTEKAAVAFGGGDTTKESAFLRANDMFDRTYGNEQQQIALAYGMEAETFAMGSRQAAIQEDRMAAVWGALFDARSDDEKELPKAMVGTQS